MDYPAYPIYRESGIEWLGKIPDHWEVRRLKFVAEIQNGRDYKEVESSEGYPVFGSGGVFRFATEYLYDGESVLFGRKGTIDKPLYVNEKFWTVDTMFYSVILEQTHGRFLYFFATTMQFNLLATQTALPSITQTDLGNYLISYPTYQEQQTIAQFLDHKTQQIDQLIAKKQTLIDKLNEQRIGLITHAVTKGLNPAVTLEDSGVEWLGEVPKHWDIRRLKFVMESFGGGTPNTSNDLYWNGDIPWVSPKDMKTKIITKTQDNITQLGLEQSSSKMIKENAVLMVVRSGILRHSIPVAINIVPVSINQDMKALIPDDTVLMPQYLQFFIDGNQKDLLDKWSKQGCTVESIESDYMLNSMMVLPPLEEQTQIVDHLDKERARIDRMVELNQQTIDKLKEYRTALITAAVTGKIDLRNWQQEANHANP